MLSYSSVGDWLGAGREQFFSNVPVGVRSFSAVSDNLASTDQCWFSYGSRFVLPEATGAQLDVLESIVLVSKG